MVALHFFLAGIDVSCYTYLGFLYFNSIPTVCVFLSLTH